MKYTIISFAVFLFAVDLSFSLQCYVCDNPDHIEDLECDNPKPKTCTPGNDVCVKLTAQRYIKSVYQCDGQYTESYNCKKYRDNCTYCREDLCNEPDDETTKNLLKCYECVDTEDRSDKPAPSTNHLEYIRQCHRKKIDGDSFFKIRCYPGEQCVTASSDLNLRRYHGCVKDTKHFCSQYKYDKCTFCDKDFCNEFDELHFNSCYICYLGNYDAKFKDAEPCSNWALQKTCGSGRQCATAYDKNGKKRYLGCGPINNNTDEFSKKYGLDHSDLCDEDACNHPYKTKCYDCRFGDISVILDTDNVNSTSCSQPTITVCGRGSSCLSLTIKINAELVGAFYYCANQKYKKDCEMKAIDCQLCDNDFCNKVEHYSTIATITAISATTAISSHEKKCYECRFGDLSPLMTNYSINSTNCSQPTITVCGPSSSCLSLTLKRNVTLIGAFHTCTTPSYFEEDCKRKGIDCQYCDDDLCNKVGNYTAITLRKAKSSAEIIKNSSVSLLNFLFILINIHAAL